MRNILSRTTPQMLQKIVGNPLVVNFLTSETTTACVRRAVSTGGGTKYFARITRAAHGLVTGARTLLIPSDPADVLYSVGNGTLPNPRSAGISVIDANTFDIPLLADPLVDAVTQPDYEAHIGVRSCVAYGMKGPRTVNAGLVYIGPWDPNTLTSAIFPVGPGEEVRLRPPDGAAWDIGHWVVKADDASSGEGLLLMYC